MRTLAYHLRPFALRYRRACSAGNSSVFSVPLCPLCQTQPSGSTRRCHAGRAWEVFFEHRGHRGTENTEKGLEQFGRQRPLSLSTPSQPEPRLVRASASGRELTFADVLREVALPCHAKLSAAWRPWWMKTSSSVGGTGSDFT